MKPRNRNIIIGTVVVFVALPVALVLITILSLSILDRSNGTIVSSAMEREYLLYVPPSYDSAKPTPLVISLHAGATWPAHQMNLSHWNRLADEHGFIVVYPAGTDMPVVNIVSSTPKMWHTFEQGAGLERDVRFICELIDRLRSKYNIDPARIYANGMSNGGGMAFVLACTLSDRIAAVGLVAPAQSLPAGWCPDVRPVPMIAFHGDADRLVPYEGGLMGDPFNPVKPLFPAVREWVALWAQRNGCTGRPVQSTVASDVTRLEYSGCYEGAAVVLYTLAGGGHSWPGGKPPPKWRVGATNTSIDATNEMWAFFRGHRLRRAKSQVQER